MKIHIKSPTRVDLAGGTLDLWPLYLLVGGATTVNVAIDIYTHAVIESLDNGRIVLESKDLALVKEYKNLGSILKMGFFSLRTAISMAIGTTPLILIGPKRDRRL